MDLLNLIISIIGFPIVGWVIWLLKNQIQSQSQTIKNLQIYADMPQKAKEFIEMREITFEDRMHKEIAKIKSEMEKKMKLRSDVLNLAIEEISSLFQIALNLAFYVNQDFRSEALERAPNSLSKSNLTKTMETLPYYGDIKLNALREVFSQYKMKHLREGQASKGKE
jgi:hypothetical protein